MINILICVCAKLLQSCLTLCNPMDHSLLSSSVHGIFQVRIQLQVGCHALPSGDLPDPGMEPVCLRSPALACGFFITNATCDVPCLIDVRLTVLPIEPSNTVVFIVSYWNIASNFLKSENFLNLLLSEREASYHHQTYIVQQMK